MLAGLLESDNGNEVPEVHMSYKPQKITPPFKGTVPGLLHDLKRLHLRLVQIGRHETNENGRTHGSSGKHITLCLKPSRSQ